MIYIGFVGNCQLLSLCFYTQFLLRENNEYTVRYISYDNAFNVHIESWADKCNNKILNYSDGIEYLKKCDFIIYNKIKSTSSVYFNTECIMSYAKEDCKLISITSIFIIFEKYYQDISELLYRDIQLDNTIKISIIIYEYMKNKDLNCLHDLLITKNHPTTLLFLNIIDKICDIINIPSYNKETVDFLIQNRNLMELPLC
jgi:hypothetical protein